MIFRFDEPLTRLAPIFLEGGLTVVTPLAPTETQAVALLTVVQLDGDVLNFVRKDLILRPEVLSGYVAEHEQRLAQVWADITLLALRLRLLRLGAGGIFAVCGTTAPLSYSLLTSIYLTLLSGGVGIVAGCFWLGGRRVLRWRLKQLIAKAL